MIDLRPDVRAYLDHAFAAGTPSIVEQDPAETRQAMRQGASFMEKPGRPMTRLDVQVEARDGHRVPARVYRPSPSTEPAEVCLFYHGGGWVLGDLESHDALCSEIAHGLGRVVVAVDYRLAPKHPFPAAVEDSLAVTRWVAASPEAIGHPVSGLILAGDSAGGALAAVLARELRAALPVPILAQWLLYPVTDLSREYPSDDELSGLFNLTKAGKERFYRFYLGDEGFAEGVRDPRVSPLLAAEWEGLPPAVVMACSHDTLRDQARAYAAKLIENGVPTVFQEASGQIHGCLSMRQILPSAEADLASGISALRGLLGDTAD
jgi:acetyl esterase